MNAEIPAMHKMQAKKKKKKMPASDSLMGDQRKLESYRKLVAAARILFTERGYHDIRTQDIAHKAGVAHGTFYFYFEDKLDCFLAFVNDVSNEMNQISLWGMPEEGTPYEMIYAMLKANFDYSSLFPGTVRAVFTDVAMLVHDNKRRKQPFFGYDGWFVLVEEWKKTGICSRNFDTKIFSYLVTGAIRQGDAYIARHPRSAKKVLAQMTRFLVNAIEAG